MSSSSDFLLKSGASQSPSKNCAAADVDKKCDASTSQSNNFGASSRRWTPGSSWHHRRNFTLKSGGDQWRHQDLVSGGHDDRGAENGSIDAPKAPSGVRYGEGCPLSSRLEDLGERHELPSGVRAEPRPLSHFLHVLGHGTLLVARKIRFCCQNSNV